MVDSRPKILFMAEATTLAHVARMSVLCSALSERFDTYMAVDPRFNGLFPERDPQKRLLLSSIPGQQFVDNLAKGRPLYTLKELKQYVEDDLQVLDQVRPDAVVGDFRLSLSVSARLRQIPYFSVSNIYWAPGVVSEHPIPAHPMVSMMGLVVAQKVFNVVRPFAFAYHTLPMNRLRRYYGLPALGANLNRVYTDSDRLLFADSPQLFPDASLTDDQAFIGPILWSPDHQLPEWWDALDKQMPCVYVTMGSSGDGSVLTRVIGQLKGLPVQLLVATAGRYAPVHRGANIHYADYLPGRLAVERSSAVICNGGSLTTYECMKAGVPVVGIASNLDQHLNMQAVDRLGAGLYLRSDQRNFASLDGYVKQCLGGDSDSAKKAVGVMCPLDPAEELGEQLQQVLG